MNKILKEYTQQLQNHTKNPSLPQQNIYKKLELEQVSELPEDEENCDSDKKPSPHGSLHKLQSLFSSPAENEKTHHKGGSDSGNNSKTAKQSAAQQKFKEELQRRCASLMIESEKLIKEENSKPPNMGENLLEVENKSEKNISEESYTEVVESRNTEVGPSTQAKSGSTLDSVQEGCEETYDVLASIKINQQRQESENVVNYIIDSDFTEPEICVSPCENCEEDLKENCGSEPQFSQPSWENTEINEEALIKLPQNSRKKHRRTDSNAIDWKNLNKILTVRQNETQENEENAPKIEEKIENEQLILNDSQNSVKNEDLVLTNSEKLQITDEF